MRVPLTTRDFLERGATVYADRIAVIDEPDQPAPGLGALTFAEVHARAQGVAAGLDAMGIAPGERIAVVSQNSARMLELLYGVTASGRILVPINFRLGAEEVAYIVEHSGASLLLIDPELEETLAGVPAPRRLVLGEDSDAALVRLGAEPRDWAADEDATATINYTSGHHRPAQGRRSSRIATCGSTRPCWHCTSASPTATSSCIRSRIFHCNGWSLPFGLAALGVPQVMLRKVDGSRDPAPRRASRRHAHGRRAGGRWTSCSTPRRVAAARPGCRPPARGRRRRPAAHAHDRAPRRRARLGVHADLRAHRDLAAAHASTAPAPSRTTPPADERRRGD